MHTPGPWKYCTGSHKDSCICGLVWAGGENVVAMVTVDRCPIGEHNDCNGPPTDQMKGNARLIAAAPDLLQACKDVLAAWLREANEGDGIMVDDECVLHAARTAIAKAEGRNV